jgi:16S rRNA (uracil1498-N3)-methyltransferase
VLLQGSEAHHLAGVRRAHLGDHVLLFNGDGREYTARIVELSRRDVTLEITDVREPAREVGTRLVVAAPLPKGERAHFLLEKLTELGATEYVPLRSERSVIDPRAGRLDRLQKYVIEASKQCGRNTLMKVKAPADWNMYCRSAAVPPRRYVAHPRKPSASAQPAVPVEAAGDISIAVGPEGGFTEAEIASGLAAGWRPVSLGPRVLRIETAAIVLAAWAAGVSPCEP